MTRHDTRPAPAAPVPLLPVLGYLALAVAVVAVLLLVGQVLLPEVVQAPGTVTPTEVVSSAAL